MSAWCSECEQPPEVCRCSPLPAGVWPEDEPEPVYEQATVSNAVVRRRGWCPECKLPLGDCTCGGAGEPGSIFENL